MKILTILPGERSRLQATAVQHLWDYVLDGSVEDYSALIALDSRLVPRPPRLFVHHGPQYPPERTT